MPLTPADIDSVKFRIEFRGYNQDDVDDFLEQVRADLVSHIEEEGRLRAQLADRLTELQQTEAIIAQPPVEPTTNPVMAAVQPQQHSEPEQVSKVLELATQAADRHIAEAQTEAGRVLADAQARGNALIQDATQRAAVIVGEASLKARDLQAEANEKVREATGGLEATVAGLEARVEELRGIAEDYQAHLSVHLQDVLDKVRNAQLV